MTQVYKQPEDHPQGPMPHARGLPGAVHLGPPRQLPSTAVQSIPHARSSSSPLGPTLRANPFPEVTDLSCRLPLSTLFYLTRGYSPWRPDAVMSTARGANNPRHQIFKDHQERTGRCEKSAAFPAVEPYLRAIRFQGPIRVFCEKLLRRKENSSRGSCWRLWLCLCCHLNIHVLVREY